VYIDIYIFIDYFNLVLNFVIFSGGVVCCTLWDDYCRKFLERYYEKPDSEKLVLILTQLKVKPATGT